MRIITKHVGVHIVMTRLDSNSPLNFKTSGILPLQSVNTIVTNCLLQEKHIQQT